MAQGTVLLRRNRVKPVMGSNPIPSAFQIMPYWWNLVDTLVLGTSTFGCGGSNPSWGTFKNRVSRTTRYKVLSGWVA